MTKVETMVADRRVLVVDDNLDLREVLETILQVNGYEAMLATNGAEALAMLRGAQKLPGVILLDLMMPVMDGRQFCAEQQQDPRLSAIPVVILTADGHADDKATVLGVSGFLAKPVDMDALLTVVGGYF
jgi:CheY-like chemotaxis protein